MFTNYLINALLNHTFGSTTYTPPSNIYLGLYTAAPTVSGGGTEVSGGGYARQEITNGSSTSQEISNSAAVDFTASGGNFGDVVAVGIFDASTSGNLMAFNSITTATVNDGTTLSFAIGDIDVAIT